MLINDQFFFPKVRHPNRNMLVSNKTQADINSLNWAGDLPNNTHVTHVMVAFDSATGVVATLCKCVLV